MRRAHSVASIPTGGRQRSYSQCLQQSYGDDEDETPRVRSRGRQSLEEIYNLLCDCATLDDIILQPQTKSEAARKLLAKDTDNFCLCRLTFKTGRQPVAIPETTRPNCSEIYILNDARKYSYGERIIVRILERRVGHPVEGIVRTRYEETPRYELCRPETAARKRTAVLCTVHLSESPNFWAQPVSNQRISRIVLPSRGACARAADGDRCYVKLLNAEDKGFPDRQLYGRVIAIEKQAHKLKYKLLLCKVVPGTYAQMEPLCGTVPRITYDNIHAQRFDLNVRKKFKEHQGNIVSRVDSEYETRIRFANEHYVTLFSVSLDPDGMPVFHPRASVSVNKDDCNKLFLVCYSLWDIGYPYPLGKVVHIINDNEKSPFKELLISIQFSLPHKRSTEEVESRLSRELSTIAMDVSTCSPNDYRKDRRDLLAVTIDADATRIYDDAVSLKKLSENVFEVGIHVTDAAYYIRSGSEVDKLAKEHLFTLDIKGPADTTRALMPRKLSAQCLSLLAKQTRKCMSVFFVVRCDVSSGCVTVQSSEICATLVKIAKNLTKEDVTSALSGRRVGMQVEVSEMLHQLWHIAKHWRLDRLGEYAFCQTRKSGESSADSEFEARCLVEELMLKANMEVATVLKRAKTAKYLVRAQDPPKTIDIDTWLKRHSGTVDHSCELSYYLNRLLHKQTDSTDDLILDRRDFDELTRTANPRQFLLSLFSEYKFSHLLPAISAWHFLSNKAEYRIVKDKPSAHFSLNTQDYVQFTSPLRRYPDLLIHRVLRAALNLGSTDIDAMDSDLEIFEEAVNDRERKFDKLMEREQALQLIDCLDSKASTQRNFSAIVERLSEGEIRIACTLESKTGRLLSVAVNPSHLGLISSPVISDDSLELAWNLRIYYHESFTYKGQAIANVDRQAESSAMVEHYLGVHSFADDVNRRVLSEFRDLKTQLTAVDGDYSRISIASARQLLGEISAMPVDQQIDEDGIHSDPGIQRRFLIKPLLKFQLQLRPGFRLRLQLCKDSYSEMPTVEPQLIEFCPNLCRCLQHRSRPVPTFAPHAQHRVPGQYASVEQYSNVWLSLLQMESATSSVSDENTFVLLHVPMTWHWDERRKKSRLFGLFTLSESYCMRRGISFGQVMFPVNAPNTEPLSDARLFIEAGRIQSYSDYVCVRASESSGGNIVLLHGGILMVCKMETHLRIIMTFNNLSGVRSELPAEATIEVIKKPMPMLREEMAVTSLAESVTKCSRSDSILMSLIFWDAHKNVAQNAHGYCQYLRECQARTFAVKVLGLPDGAAAAGRTKIVPCNESQSRAIMNSLKSVISFIWGPPGTGKTLTGVLIAYWYSRVNRWLDEAEPIHSENDQVTNNDTFNFVKINFQDLDQLPIRKSGYTPTRARSRGMSVKVGSDEVTVKTRRQVLYCGPSNRSVDVVVEYMLEKLGDKCPKLLRVFSNYFELSKYPTPFYKASTSRQISEVTWNDVVNRVALHEVIRHPDSPNSWLLRDFDQVFAAFCNAGRRTARAMIPCLVAQFQKSPKFRQALDQHLDKMPAFAAAFGSNEVDDTCNSFFDSLAALVKVYETAVRVAKIHAFQEADVVLCTTSSGASSLMQLACKFSQIIIDEAGMCTQPEILVPLVGRTEPPTESSLLMSSTSVSGRGAPCASSCAERLVLLGDHKQLRPLVKSREAVRLGFNTSFMEAHQVDSVMLDEQYRMHPSLADFPAMEFYRSRLVTRPSPSWTGVDPDTDLIDPDRQAEWSGLNLDMLRPNMFDWRRGGSGDILPGRLTTECVNIFHGRWPGVRSRDTCKRQGHVYRTLPRKLVRPSRVGNAGEEDRVVFLHREGEEELSQVAGEDGGEFSRKNEREIETAVQMYADIYNRLTGRRRDSPESCVAIISQYRYQVLEITRRIKQRQDLPLPTVKTVIACQGSEFDYVILSLVRSCPAYLIPKSSMLSWELKYLGFITDENQINVALTRARRGLIIIGNSHLLKANEMWKRLLTKLEGRGCVLHPPELFPGGNSQPLLAPGFATVSSSSSSCSGDDEQSEAVRARFFHL